MSENIQNANNEIGIERARSWLSHEDKKLLKLLVNVNIVGAVIGIPVGFYLLKRWPEQTLAISLALTAVGIAVKYFMMHGHHKEEESIELDLEHEMVAAMAN